MILKKSLLLFIRLSVVNAAFYSAISNHGKLNDKDVIYKTTAPSSISCLLQCRVIDAEADAIFDQNVCSCIKGRTQKDDTKEVSLTGICLKVCCRIFIAIHNITYILAQPVISSASPLTFDNRI